MSKQLFTNSKAQRGSAIVSIPMYELYALMYAQLQHVKGIDPDALCQQICVLVEKHQCTFPNIEGVSNTTGELTSALPHGVPFPGGDPVLWDACEAECAITHKDTMQRYADVRGITRTDAKNETFTIRYGSGGMQKMGRATRDAPKGVPNIVEDWSLTVKDKLKREDF